MSGASRLVVISGCSGGGKSTLLAEFAARGHRTVEEPGRRIVREELASGGNALPWTDPAAFLRRAIAMSLNDLESVGEAQGWVFFDRGLIDACDALQTLTGEPAAEQIARSRPFYRRIFLAPPWREIYLTDAERRHGFEAGVAEYERQVRTFPALGFEVITLPRLAVAARADFVLAALEAA
ncbi:MAG TPA: AAA family ATPase [Caulobacteraceae bacterium]|jgi:predicted ATPase|nr:AAA family ATPase [Caulobacteraceae bacterium]